MAIHSFIPLAAAIVYILLLIIIIANRQWQKQHMLLACYLIAASFWTLSDFLLRSDTLAEYKLILFRIVICSSMWWCVQFLYFVRSFLNLPGGLGVWFGYISLALFITLTVFGHIPPSITFDGGVVSPTYGWWIILYITHFLTITSLGVYSLIQRFRRSVEPKERNKIAYLIVAIGLLVAFGFSGMTPLARGFPVSHLGGLLSASILTYAVVKHEIVSFNFVIRRGLSWAGLIVVIVSIYLVVFFLINLLVGSEMKPIILASTTLAAVAMAVIVYLLRNFFISGVDRFFYKDSYDYRQELFDFVRHGISGVFSLQELSEGLLPPLVKVLDCQQAHMLLPETRTDDFVAEFSEPHRQKNPPLRLRHDSPIVEWLERENRYLSRENIDILPEFRSLWGGERDKLKNLGIELFFPLVSRDNLTGILALSRKQSGRYSLEDANLVESIASRVAISLEKEYLQAELRKSEQELSLINRLAGVMTSSLNIQEVYDAFVAGLREVVDVDFASVALVEGNELYLSALSTEVGSAWQVGERIQLKGTATEWAISHKKSLIEPDLARDRMFSTSEDLLNRGIRSIVYLPLITKGEVIGNLTIASRNPNAYSKAQVHLLERLSSQISTSIANAQLYARAEQRARIDELTGLFNRRHFDENLKHEVGRHSRYGSVLSLAFLDLDNFKSYNDTMGHLVGDKLLTQTGQSIRGSLRNIDLAFRYGGDEFAIIMPHTSADDAFAAAERIRNRIATEMGGRRIAVTASIGLASWPNDGLTPDDIINAADKALYHAKLTGGNRTCVISQMLPSITEPLESTPAAEKETLNTIYALAATIEARDPYTYGHSRKVRGYAVALAEALALPMEKVTIVSHAALLHDIGKIGILDEVLNKANKLDIQEWELIKSHPQLSRTIVGHVPSLTPCLPAILHHHEHWDGTGYPAGLKGNAIPLEARILTIADAFDAMTSLRPYRAPLSYKEAVEELKRCAGTQFDPNLVESFLPIALTTNPDELEATYDPVSKEVD